jgi:hypothetical protein
LSSISIREMIWGSFLEGTWIPTSFRWHSNPIHNLICLLILCRICGSTKKCRSAAKLSNVTRLSTIRHSRLARCCSSRRENDLWRPIMWYLWSWWHISTYNSAIVVLTMRSGRKRRFWAIIWRTVRKRGQPICPSDCLTLDMQNLGFPSKLHEQNPHCLCTPLRWRGDRLSPSMLSPAHISSVSRENWSLYAMRKAQAKIVWE